MVTAPRHHRCYTTAPTTNIHGRYAERVYDWGAAAQASPDVDERANPLVPDVFAAAPLAWRSEPPFHSFITNKAYPPPTHGFVLPAVETREEMVKTVLQGLRARKWVDLKTRAVCVAMAAPRVVSTGTER